MNEFRVIELKEGVYKLNNEAARNLRETLKLENTFLLNLMSSPGAGKTTLLLKTIEALKDRMNIAVMEADIDSDVDARTISKTGVPVIQLHTGGMCHLDAEMTRQGIESLRHDIKDSGGASGSGNPNLIILENIGNLICTADFDTGAAKNATILSIPEGDDKPLKYPKIFQISDALIISKTDTLPVFDFDIGACTVRAKKLNPSIEIFPVSAKTGEGMAAWIDWLIRNVNSEFN
ncbi:MAG: hydrogenase nickel incorporation protein HypB [Treponema sp.]|jgi:hydrogenase nickel incorporation protein HypB|nr:hydrogenase nickel incorporation protein HypB [Treponema sp.]